MSVPENFISYEDYENIKQEKEFESSKFEEDFSADTESTGNFPNNYFYQNNLTLFDNLAQTYSENWENFQERTYNPKQPFKIIRNCNRDSPDFQVKVEQEDRVLTKTKRIMKREKAKQRVMIKQEISTISDISSKYIPEGFNDPDLDDKTKKKMIQMIRNRISAQNSRDRKKMYVQQLEALQQKLADESRLNFERSKKLQEENKRLIAMNAQLMEENLRLKSCNTHTCANCGHSTDASSINSPLSNENPPSPNYNPFSGSPKSKAFASFFCVATIISCLMYNNLASQGITLPNSTGLQPFRALGEANDMIKVEEADPCMVKMESDLNNFGESILKNIRPLKEEFQQNHLAVYQDMEKKQGFCVKETQPAVKIEEDEHAVIDYRPLSQNFLSKEASGEKKNLPVLSNSNINKEASTLFVHNGIQLLDEDEKRGGLEEDKSKHDLKNNEFLQLIVPRHSLKNLNLRDFVHTFSNMIQDGNNDENSMLELWVKVFYVRELSSNSF